MADPLADLVALSRQGERLEFHPQGTDGIEKQISPAGFQAKRAICRRAAVLIDACSEPSRTALLVTLGLVTNGYASVSDADFDKLIHGDADLRRRRHAQDCDKWPSMATLAESQVKSQTLLQLDQSAAPPAGIKTQDDAATSTLVRDATSRIASTMELGLKPWVGAEYCFPGTGDREGHSLTVDLVRVMSQDSSFSFTNVEKELGLPEFRDCLRHAVFLRAFHDTVVTSYDEGSKIMSGLVDRRTGNPALVEVVLVFLAGYLTIVFCLEKRLPANKFPELPIPFVFQLMVEAAMGRMKSITKVTLNNLRLVSPYKEIVFAMLAPDARWAAAWTDMSTFKKGNAETALVMIQDPTGGLSDAYGADTMHRATSSRSPHRKFGRREDKGLGKGVQEPRSAKLSCSFCASRGSSRAHTHPLHGCFHLGAQYQKSPDAPHLKKYLALIAKEGKSIPVPPPTWGKKRG